MHTLEASIGFLYWLKTAKVVGRNCFEKSQQNPCQKFGVMKTISIELSMLKIVYLRIILTNHSTGFRPLLQLGCSPLAAHQRNNRGRRRGLDHQIWPVVL